MVRENIIKYIGIPHSYEGINCLTIIHEFYKNELNLDCIAQLIPDDIEGRRWMRKFTLPQIENWALIHGKKVLLTEAQDFDLIVFKSPRLSRPIHFGMFMKPCKMLHLEEGRASRFETISNEWANCISALYRHNDLV